MLVILSLKPKNINSCLHSLRFDVLRVNSPSYYVLVCETSCQVLVHFDKVMKSGLDVNQLRNDVTLVVFIFRPGVGGLAADQNIVSGIDGVHERSNCRLFVCSLLVLSIQSCLSV